ncbi:MAG TPA: UDP-glucose 4-epimerase [Nitrospinae bacterium]|nr:UDP-glucose 4-epimerase [Nitrospinota bacterium]HBA27512.1 UDP-glucose 4-epimerase [Nitrospinota bacterium]
MNILITGGAGFIGSNIVDRYIKEGHQAIIADNLITGKVKNINAKAKFYKIDIRDREGLESIFKENKIDIISHHAAQMDVRKSVDDPIYDADVNILGSLNLLQLAVKHKIKKFIFASTGGAVYGEQDYFPADEKHPPNPLSPYGISKLALEKYLYFYKMTYNLNHTILRYANVYGPRQDPHGEAGVVAIFAKKILKGEPPIINGDGGQTRDYTFVEDVVEANVLVIKNGINGIYNIGTGIETSVNELCNIMLKTAGADAKPVHGPAKMGEQRRSVISCNKINSECDWTPKNSIKDGISKTINFFKDEQREG